jgi:hypothetical protein
VIIAIIGPKGSGKTLVAKYLTDRYGFVRHPFAGPLKKMLTVGLGLNDDQLYGDQKEIPTELLCGKTPRQAMQLLGSEWGRDLIHPNLWATAWRSTMPNGNVVVDDMRFPNEYEAIRKMNGVVISVRRPGHEYSADHESEKHELEWDYRLPNAGSVSELTHCAGELMTLIEAKM